MAEGVSIACRNLTVGYDGHPALHHLSLAIAGGSLTAVIGPNGAGKSTFLRTVVGLIEPLEGRMTVEGCERRHIGYLPQQIDIDRSFPIPVFDFVAMGLWRRRGLFSAFSRGDDEAVAGVLASVGLAGFEDRTLDTLSGGQLQRVLFARLLMQDASLMLLDEPFSAVDDRTIDDLMAIVLGWHAEGRTVLAVLHDIERVRAHFPTTLLIARQCIAHGPTAAVLTADNLARARRMTEAWDETAPVCEEDAA